MKKYRVFIVWSDGRMELVPPPIIKGTAVGITTALWQRWLP